VPGLLLRRARLGRVVRFLCVSLILPESGKKIQMILVATS
jgi:hypothetical protein